MVTIARIRRAHGVTGALLIEEQTDFPERFEALETVWILPPEEAGEGTRYRVLKVRHHAKGLILHLEGIRRREQAEELAGHWVAVPRAQAVELEPGEHYAFDLVGLEVVTEDGTRLGTLTEVHHYPAHDVYAVWDETREREILLPAIEDVVKEIDVAGGRMRVVLIDGLVD